MEHHDAEAAPFSHVAAARVPASNAVRDAPTPTGSRPRFDGWIVDVLRDVHGAVRARWWMFAATCSKLGVAAQVGDGSEGPVYMGGFAVD